MFALSLDITDEQSVIDFVQAGLFQFKKIDVLPESVKTPLWDL
jgi:NADP-dependent 3-hydroxy acid dehydrogenase YdfG